VTDGVLAAAIACSAIAQTLLVGGGLLSLRGQMDGERKASAISAVIALFAGLIAAALGPASTLEATGALSPNIRP
jgi:hypothetical protein